jgi:hypothetical protein
MQADLVEMLVAGLRMDNAILAQRVALGEPVPLVEIVELAAATRALFNSVTLASRDSSFRVDQCLKLWIETRKVFEELRGLWENVPSDDGAILFHRAQLSRLIELAASREDLYRISQSERLEHVARKGDDLGTAFGSSGEPKEEPGSWTDTQPAHVYSMGQI